MVGTWTRGRIERQSLRKTAWAAERVISGFIFPKLCSNSEIALMSFIPIYSLWSKGLNPSRVVLVDFLED